MQLLAQYVTTRAKAVPGLVYGNALDFYIDGTLIANEALEPGRLVVLDVATGQLKVPANAAAAALTEEIVGVVVFQTTAMQTAIPAAGFTYPAGARVPVLRKGRIWVQVSSSAEPTPYSAARIKHSSTVATDRGKFTTDAAAATATAEVADPGNLKFIEKATTTLWLAELNLP